MFQGLEHFICISSFATSNRGKHNPYSSFINFVSIEHPNLENTSSRWLALYLRKKFGRKNILPKSIKQEGKNKRHKTLKQLSCKGSALRRLANEPFQTFLRRWFLSFIILPKTNQKLLIESCVAESAKDSNPWRPNLIQELKTKGKAIPCYKRLRLLFSFFSKRAWTESNDIF